MNGKGILSKGVLILSVIIVLVLPHQVLRSEDNKLSSDCVNKAFKRLREIESLPEMKYLDTLDGQNVLLDEFYTKCLLLFPKCSLYRKFYYWQSEIREVASRTQNGLIKHKIRSYYNCISASCPESYDPRKTHGDVAEFYDRRGNFMGLAVYVKDGKYCSLPYDNYENLIISPAISDSKYLDFENR
jgi:hypothetical protein